MSKTSVLYYLVLNKVVDFVDNKYTKLRLTYTVFSIRIKLTYHILYEQ